MNDSFPLEKVKLFSPRTTTPKKLNFILCANSMVKELSN